MSHILEGKNIGLGDSGGGGGGGRGGDGLDEVGGNVEDTVGVLDSGNDGLGRIGGG